MVEATSPDQALAAWLAEQEIELLDDSSVCSRELTGWVASVVGRGEWSAGQSAGDDGLRDHSRNYCPRPNRSSRAACTSANGWIFTVAQPTSSSAESGCQCKCRLPTGKD